MPRRGKQFSQGVARGALSRRERASHGLRSVSNVVSPLTPLLPTSCARLSLPCQSREVRLLQQKLPPWPDRRSPQHFSPFNVLAVQDAALSPDNRVVIQPRMLADPDLPADQGVSPDGGTPGDTRLRRNDRVFPDLDVMRNLD